MAANIQASFARACHVFAKPVGVIPNRENSKKGKNMISRQKRAGHCQEDSVTMDIQTTMPVTCTQEQEPKSRREEHIEGWRQGSCTRSEAHQAGTRWRNGVEARQDFETRSWKKIGRTRNSPITRGARFKWGIHPTPPGPTLFGQPDAQPSRRPMSGSQHPSQCPDASPGLVSH